MAIRAAWQRRLWSDVGLLVTAGRGSASAFRAESVHAEGVHAKGVHAKDSYSENGNPKDGYSENGYAEGGYPKDCRAGSSRQPYAGLPQAFDGPTNEDA